MAHYMDCQKEEKLTQCIRDVGSTDKRIVRWTSDSAALYAYDLGVCIEYHYDGHSWNVARRREI